MELTNVNLVKAMNELGGGAFILQTGDHRLLNKAITCTEGDKRFVTEFKVAPLGEWHLINENGNLTFKE